MKRKYNINNSRIKFIKYFLLAFLVYNCAAPDFYTIEDVEKELIYATLEKVNGNKTMAAEMLGISTKTLYNRLHAYGDLSKEE
mgnify:CR=1 FL=1